MENPTGAGKKPALRVTFDSRSRAGRRAFPAGTKASRVVLEAFLSRQRRLLCEAKALWAAAKAFCGFGQPCSVVTGTDCFGPVCERVNLE